MDFYEFLKVLHVVAAVVWVGGASVTQLYAIRATRTSEPERIVNFSSDAEWVGTRVFLPMSLILVATGFGMIGDASLDFEAWIVIGLAVWVISAGVGASFLGPESGRIAKVVETEGAASPNAQARIKRIFLISRIELVLLLIVVVDMVVKPGV
jgi:uncharacterized membrane protein